MIRRTLAALAVTLVLVTGLLAGSAPAQAVGNAWCQGNAFAPSKTGSYVTGRGNMQCSNYSDLTGWRFQLVLQDENGNNIAGTATGWIYTPAYSYIGTTPTNSASLCLTTNGKYYRTEIQISATHKVYGYSGIKYGQTAFVTVNCGIAGYS